MIAGITKVRNESEIIKDTLEHYAKFCDRLYVYDDCSTDDTVDICVKFGAVTIRGDMWCEDRMRSEYINRQRVLDYARMDNPDWILAFDADERIEWDFRDYDDYDGVRMGLFDFYITEEDKDKPYGQRKYIGPERRDIIMMYRNHDDALYCFPDQREIFFSNREPRILNAGYVKHYGKAISIQQWEDTCTYYETYFPEPYKTKWKNRHGKAIHTQSDFGRPLIRWEEKETKGRSYA